MRLCFFRSAGLVLLHVFARSFLLLVTLDWAEDNNNGVLRLDAL